MAKADEFPDDFDDTETPEQKETRQADLEKVVSLLERLEIRNLTRTYTEPSVEFARQGGGVETSFGVGVPYYEHTKHGFLMIDGLSHLQGASLTPVEVMYTEEITDESGELKSTSERQYILTKTGDGELVLETSSTIPTEELDTTVADSNEVEELKETADPDLYELVQGQADEAMFQAFDNVRANKMLSMHRATPEERRIFLGILGIAAQGDPRTLEEEQALAEDDAYWRAFEVEEEDRQRRAAEEEDWLTDQDDDSDDVSRPGSE